MPDKLHLADRRLSRAWRWLTRRLGLDGKTERREHERRALPPTTTQVEKFWAELKRELDVKK